MYRTLLCLIAFGTAPVAAQQSPFVGTWQLTYPLGVGRDGTPQMATGVLTIVTQADSLVGTLVMDSTPGMPTQPVQRLVAKAGTGAATFASRSEITLMVNFEERKGTIFSSWTLAVNGGDLTGTLARTVEGMGPAGGGQVTGTRRKS